MNQLEYSPHLKDENFIPAIQSGGPQGESAIIKLYTKYHKSVLSAIADLIPLHPGCKTEPEDMLHDAFILMIHKIQFERKHVSSIKLYWIGIAKKLILNQVKKNRRITLVNDPEILYGNCDITPESMFLITERNQLIEKYLSLFGNRCRDTLLLWLKRYTMEEIAEKLNLSGAPMARKIKHTCFKKLKMLVLKGNLFGPEDIAGRNTEHEH